jgi:hypothetical protein
MRIKDRTGQRFGQLVAESLAPKRGRRTFWKCHCDCGETVEVVADNLVSGHTTSCGCAHRDMLVSRNKTLLAKHGHVFGGKPSRTYSSWRAMLTRCTVATSVGFDNYGGRGIRVCERWHKFEDFLADMGERPAGKTLDRYPDQNGNYEPVNCRWATPVEQAQNRRPYQPVMPPRQSIEFYRAVQRKAAASRAAKSAITAFGETKTLAEWAAALGMHRKQVWQRLKRGWPPEQAVSVPRGGSYASV